MLQICYVVLWEVYITELFGCIIRQSVKNILSYKKPFTGEIQSHDYLQTIPNISADSNQTMPYHLY